MKLNDFSSQSGHNSLLGLSMRLHFSRQGVQRFLPQQPVSTASLSKPSQTLHEKSIGMDFVGEKGTSLGEPHIAEDLFLPKRSISRVAICVISERGHCTGWPFLTSQLVHATPTYVSGADMRDGRIPAI